MEALELAELRAVLIAVLFRLLPLVDDFLLDAQLFMVLCLRGEDEFLELGHLSERFDLVNVAQCDKCALEERNCARRSLFLLLDAAELYELFQTQSAGAQLIELLVNLLIEPVIVGYQGERFLIFLLLFHFYLRALNLL